MMERLFISVVYGPMIYKCIISKPQHSILEQSVNLLNINTTES